MEWADSTEILPINWPSGQDAVIVAIAYLAARKALEAINKYTSPGNRTLDEMIRDMGYACDIARAALA